MGDPVSTIKQGPVAAHTSGTRPTSAIVYGIIHCTEDADPTRGDEQVAAYFHGSGSGGSTQYVVDNDTTTRCLPDTAVCWGAPPLNASGVHIEQSGKSSLSRAAWIKTYTPQIDRVAWLMAHLSHLYGVPLRWLTAAQLVKLGTKPAHGHGGWARHSDVSAAWHQTTHTDPGSGYPADVLMSKAQAYLAAMSAPAASKPPATPADPALKHVTATVGGGKPAPAALYADDRRTVIATLPHNTPVTVLGKSAHGFTPVRAHLPKGVTIPGQIETGHIG